jgi:hypothetical protein
MTQSTGTQSVSANAFKAGAINSISMEVAREKAPAIFATEPASYINTNRYHFTPTFEIIDMMKDMGYLLTNAKQSKSKIDLRINHGVHIVEFQHPDLYVKDSTNNEVEARPTIVMVNSSDGSRPFDFQMGMFRLVCSNGLIVKDKDLGGFKERHTKYNFTDLKAMISSKVDMLPKTIEKINSWNQIEMSHKDRFAFATEALALRLSSDRLPAEYEIREILSPKRSADKHNNLWCTYNVVQENLIKGGFQLNERQARPITNPWQDLELNKGLWALAEKFETVK